MAEIVRPRAYGVAEINYYLKEYLEEDSFLSSLAVQGEIGNFKAHSSGHCFFTLQEGDSSLKAVMFRSAAAALSWRPRDGDRAIAVGAISLYQRDGSCQLYVQTLLPDGAGPAAHSMEELRQKLEAEGLFDPARKRPLPRYAMSVGVITSGDGAAWADISRIISQRHPGCELRLYPALVQGEQAPASLIAALAQAQRGGHQVLLIGRGGGAEADLAAFNSETVVRAVADSIIPIISAVGHESDFTLCDLAADQRAATPTHGAALAVPERAQVLALLEDQAARLQAAAQQGIKRQQQRLQQAAPRLQAAAQAQLSRYEQRLATGAARLELLSPVATLARGYSLAVDEHGQAIHAAAQTEPGRQIIVYPASGRISAVVERVEQDISLTGAGGKDG